MGRFVVHSDLLEPFIAFSRGQGMMDEQEASVRKAFTNKNFLHTLTSGDFGVGCPLNPHPHRACCINVKQYFFSTFLGLIV